MGHCQWQSTGVVASGISNLRLSFVFVLQVGAVALHLQAEACKQQGPGQAGIHATCNTRLRHTHTHTHMHVHKHALRFVQVFGLQRS